MRQGPTVKGAGREQGRNQPLKHTHIHTHIQDGRAPGHDDMESRLLITPDQDAKSGSTTPELRRFPKEEGAEGCELFDQVQGWGRPTSKQI